MNVDHELEAAQELDRPDDFEFFKSFKWDRIDYKAWALIPAIVFGATVINAFVVGWIVWSWVTGRGARHRPVAGIPCSAAPLSANACAGPTARRRQS